MEKNICIDKIILVFLVLLILPWQNAFAYTDPGTMTWLLQIVIAVAITGLITIKSIWREIIAFIKRSFKKPRK